MNFTNTNTGDPPPPWGTYYPTFPYVPAITLEPHKCPVCDGRGHVPFNFYSGATIVAGLAPKTCKTCHGHGILWR